MAKLNFHLLDQESQKMIADYLRNRELGNLTIARFIKGKFLRVIKAKQARKALTFRVETPRKRKKVL